MLSIILYTLCTCNLSVLTRAPCPHFPGEETESQRAIFPGFPKWEMTELGFKSRPSESKASTSTTALQPPLTGIRRPWEHGEQTDAPGQPIPFRKAQQIRMRGRQASQGALGCDQRHPGRWALSGVGESEPGSRSPVAEMWGQQLQPHWPPPHNSNMPSILLHQGHMCMLFPLPVMPSPRYTPGLLPRPLPVSAQMSPSPRGLPYHPI